MTSRRTFIASLSALAAAHAFDAKAALALTKTAPSRLGIAYTSVPIRSRQGREANKAKGPGVPAEQFIELCASFGASGCQMDIAQLVSTDADYLKRLRAMLDAKGMFMELAVGSKTLENPEAFARVAATAGQLGASRLRMVCLSGRRYEDFNELAKWQEFIGHCKTMLKASEPLLKKYKLVVGLENHKDWLADDLAELMKNVSSQYLGVCIDFGNNIALLEDPVEVIQKLAPFAVTTHLKDMAVGPYNEGFELAEVALGDGMLPLAKMVAIVRKARPDANLCLEMLTRDPLKVPYKTDHYWITFPNRDQAQISKFENTVLKKSSSKPLPGIAGMTPQQALAFEDQNIRRSMEYAKQKLKL